MALTTVRNVAIILGISAAVYFLPGGGTAAAVVSWAIFTAFAVALCWMATMLYRRFRGDIYSLGDTGRALLYGGIGGLVIAGAGAPTMLDTTPGLVVWVAIAFGSVYALVLAWRRRGLA